MLGTINPEILFLQQEDQIKACLLYTSDAADE